MMKKLIRTNLNKRDDHEKIAVIAFGMLLFILPTKAQTLESQYGLDSANTILNASLYTEY